MAEHIIGYAERECRRMDAAPFSDVDSLILSQLAYLKWEKLPFPVRGAGLTVGGLHRTELYAPLLDGIRDAASNRALLNAVSASPRWREIRAVDFSCAFDPARDMQFAAVQFCLPDGSGYIAFRGTDSTFVGWKEDLNMAFLCPVPSQAAAADYLNACAARTDGPLCVGGHSKGGNLAVYAAVCCDSAVKKRITAAYSHDGPGFPEPFFALPAYREMAGRLQKTLPKSSLVGMLLENRGACRIVDSDRFWVMQHDPFSWTVDNGRFVPAGAITGGADQMNRTLHAFVVSLSDAERERFVEALFEVLNASGESTMRDLSASLARDTLPMLSAVRELDPEARAMLLTAVKQLAALYVKNLPRRSRHPGLK